MEKQGILLVSHGAFEDEFLEKIAFAIAAELEVRVTTEKSQTDITSFYDPIRRQYDANKILKHLDSTVISEGQKIIGLFKVDLFIPILTFIFGQALFKGNTGIVSLYRLRNEQYGLPANEELLLERFKKVIIHELGHTFGLVHCHVPNCVMRSTTYVEEIDQKDYHFCSKCRSEMAV